MFAKVKAAREAGAPVIPKWQRTARDATGKGIIGARCGADSQSDIGSGCGSRERYQNNFSR
jgi:hypothetical protein